MCLCPGEWGQGAGRENYTCPSPEAVGRVHEARADAPDVKQCQSSRDVWVKFRSLSFIPGALHPLKDGEPSKLEGI